jgi:hypothetical protein
MRKGKRQLDGSGAGVIREVPFEGDYHCYALLYLFVNHTSLDDSKSVDDLEPGEENLKHLLNQNAGEHLRKTKLALAGDL